MSYQSINPYNGEWLMAFDEHTDAQIEKAIAEAKACFEVWSRKSFAERAEVVFKAAELMRKRKERLAMLATLEMGKLMGESRDEVMLAAEIIDYYAEHAEVFLATEFLNPSGGEASIVYEPLGIWFGLQPWNFPFYQLSRFAAPNLMAGNVVIVKHASGVPQCASALEQIWQEASALPGLYTNLFISHEQVCRMINDPRIKGVSVTGSASAGKSIAACAGQNLKKSTLELGGCDAFIVLDDADLQKAVDWAVWAKMNNNGQCLSAAKRFIVVEPLADCFLLLLQSALRALEPGDPMYISTTLAPMSSETALHHVLSQVEQAVMHGATLRLGGKRIDREGFFMQPTLLANVTPDNPIYRSEVLGPVALFFRVRNEEEAVAIANDSDYGLGCSIFTKNLERGKRLAKSINAGMVFINHPTWTTPELPFGGTKNCSYGRDLYMHGIQEFINKKLIRVDTLASVDVK